MENEILKIDEVAKIFRVSKWTIDRLLRAGKLRIRCQNLGTGGKNAKWRFLKSDVDNYIKNEFGNLKAS